MLALCPIRQRLLRHARHLAAALSLLALATSATPAVAAKRPPKAAKSKAVAPLPLPDAPATAPRSPAPLQVSSFVLDNGMRVVVQRDASAPLVAVGIWVDVGSRDEAQGKSGLAHFFEHMMFQGSKKLAKMEHFTAIESVGGEVNANTTADRTWYYQVVPKPALPLALWLEAERLAHLQIDDKSVENQRQTVLEERRQRYENTPYAASQLKLVELVFQSWALQHSTIGEAEDLQRAPVSDFAEFFARWYAPARCTLVLSGDVTEAEARTLAQQYLGAVPRRAAADHPPLTEPDAVQDSFRHKSASMGDALAQTPAVHMAWPAPAGLQADVFALDLLADILGGGSASRLERVLVRDKTLVSQYWAGTHGRKDRDLFHIYLELADNDRAAVAEVKRRVRAQLHDLALRGPTDKELADAKTSFAAGWVFGLESAATRAMLLAQFASWYGDAAKLDGLLASYRAVTPADVQRVARQYLSWEREVELDVLPGKAGFGLTPVKKPAEVQAFERDLAKQLKAEADAKAKAEADAKAAEEAKRKAEADAKAAEEARIKAEAEAKAKAEADAKAQAEAAANPPAVEAPVPLPAAATATTPGKAGKSAKKKAAKPVVAPKAPPAAPPAPARDPAPVPAPAPAPAPVATTPGGVVAPPPADGSASGSRFPAPAQGQASAPAPIPPPAAATSTDADLPMPKRVDKTKPKRPGGKR